MSHSSFMPRADYAVTQKVLHWLMALLIMLDLIIAQKFGGEMADWDRFASRSDHASVGITIAVLLVLRLYSVGATAHRPCPPICPIGKSNWRMRRIGRFMGLSAC